MADNTTLRKKRTNISFMLIFTILTIILFYFVFLVFPIFFALYGSFFDWNPLVEKLNYVGLDNYLNVFKDRIFWISIKNTFYFTFAVLILRTDIGLFLAVAVSSLKKFKAFFRTAFFTPAITSMVAVGILWKWIYAPKSGLINSFLAMFGIQGPRWLSNQYLVLPAIIVMTAWKDLGFPFVVFLAGITSISSSFYEFSRIEGATKWQTFKYITFPLLRPTLLFLLVTGLISYFQVITQILVMTKPAGGPGYASFTLAYFLYNSAFTQYKFGYASAIAFIILILIMIFTAIQFRVMKTDWRY